jgi:hypothetical protein
MSYSYQQSFNASQNALAKADRKAAKLAIAAQDRSQRGTNSYRPLNQTTPPGTVSPTVGHPWTQDPTYVAGIGSTATFL